MLIIGVECNVVINGESGVAPPMPSSNGGSTRYSSKAISSIKMLECTFRVLKIDDGAMVYVVVVAIGRT